MKVILEKKIENGKYFVSINVSDYTAEEIEKIKTFGAPQISISPKSMFLNGQFVNSLPLHGMNYSFQFDNEAAATNFSNSITERIKSAVKVLKERKDDFSSKDEIKI